MLSDVSGFIITYGYLAVLLIVMMQAIGIPVPIPVELTVMIIGYIAYTGLLKLPVVFVLVIAGDFIGSIIVYYIFYLFDSYILQRKPKWLPLNQKMIDKIAARVAVGGTRTLYTIRLSPFIRGYICIIAGLTQIRPRVFLPILLITSAVWSTIYLSAGWLLAPYWGSVEHHFTDIKYIMAGITLIILLVVAYWYFKRGPGNNSV